MSSHRRLLDLASGTFSLVQNFALDAQGNIVRYMVDERGGRRDETRIQLPRHRLRPDNFLVVVVVEINALIKIQLP